MPGQVSVSKTQPVILIIEDDPLLVKMYKTKLTMEGFQVLEAEDGQMGLKMALEKTVNLILLDIMMPKMSGIDLLQALRQNPKGKNIPVIVMSNLIDQEKFKKAQELGVKDFLVKSNLTPSQVVTKIRQYLT